MKIHVSPKNDLKIDTIDNDNEKELIEASTCTSHILTNFMLKWETSLLSKINFFQDSQ